MVLNEHVSMGLTGLNEGSYANCYLKVVIHVNVDDRVELRCKVVDISYENFKGKCIRNYNG